MKSILSFRNYLLFCLLISTLEVFAQELIVSGTVKSATGGTLPGVSVVVKGTTQGTITDANGAFTLKVADPNATLVFTSIGMTTEEVPLNSRTLLDVNLVPDIQALSEVVVVGYGTQERRNLTGAVSSIKSQDIENIPVASANSLLQGRAAGVMVTQNSGAPGSGATIRIRGVNSITGSNEPLYVIDGVPVKSEDNSGLADVGSASTGSATLNPMADLNPNDIESIEVLKDASSTAIYGARGANGVVLITTKRGKSGKSSVTLNYYTGIAEVRRRIPVMNASEYRNWVLEGNANDNRGLGGAALDSLNPSNSADIFWQDEVLRQAPVSNYDLAIRGGKEGAIYSLSLGYFDQQGVLIGSQFKRFTARLNTEFAANKRIRFGESFSYSRGFTNRTSMGESPRSVIHAALVKAPFYPIYRLDGTYTPQDPINRQNPVAVADVVTQDALNHRLTGNLYGIVDLYKGLDFKASVQMDLLSLKEDRFLPDIIAASENRQASSRYLQDRDWISEFTLNYNRTLGGRHSIGGLLGYIVQENKTEVMSIRTEGAPTNSITTTNASPVIREASTRASRWGIASYIGRLNYGFDDRYLVTINVRRDASSRFGKDNRVGVFPSASAGWRVSSENFLRSITFINDLKLRASYGIVGNQSIGNYAAQGIYEAGLNYGGAGGIGPARNGIANSNLKWETSKSFNVGMDLTFYDNRFTLVPEYYIRTTDDLLLEADVPRNSGYTRVLRNVGSLENQGFELTFTSINIDKGSFKWSSNLNFAFPQTKVLKLNSGENEIASAGLSQSLTRVGLPVGTFYGWVAEGVYAYDEDNTAGLKNVNGYVYKGGDIIFKDLDGNGVIDDNDRTIIGDPNPEFLGGFSNTFSYKGLELMVFAQYSYGNDIYNAKRKDQDEGRGGNNATKDGLRRWKTQGQITDFPRVDFGDPSKGNNGRHSSRWVEDGSYLRLKTVTLSYTLPSALLSKIYINTAKVYVTAQNLWTFTNYKGFDPEVNGYSGALSFGVDNGVFPQSKSITAGLNISF